MRTPLHSRNGKNRRSRRAADVQPPETKPSDATAHTGDPLAPLIAHLTELREFVRYYASTRLDQWRMRVRSALQSSVVGAINAIIVATSLVMATILFWRGAAAAVAELCGRPAWLGDVIVGSAILLAASCGTWLWARRRTATDLQTVIEKHEHEKQSEREELGTDIAERAQPHHV